MGAFEIAGGRRLVWELIPRPDPPNPGHDQWKRLWTPPVGPCFLSGLVYADLVHSAVHCIHGQLCILFLWIWSILLYTAFIDSSTFYILTDSLHSVVHCIHR